MHEYVTDTVHIPARHERVRRYARTICDVCEQPIQQPNPCETQQVTIREVATPAGVGNPVRTTSFDCCPDCFARHVLPLAKRHVVETSEVQGNGWRIAPTSRVVP